MVVFDLKQFSTRQRLPDVLSAGTMSSPKYKQRWKFSSRRAQRTFHDVLILPEDDMRSHAGSMYFQEADVPCVESSFTTPVRSPLVSVELPVCMSLMFSVVMIPTSRQTSRVRILYHFHLYGIEIEPRLLPGTKIPRPCASIAVVFAPFLCLKCWLVKLL
jgi:hypothetical protein